jgi:hypothetical protein
MNLQTGCGRPETPRAGCRSGQWLLHKAGSETALPAR